VKAGLKLNKLVSSLILSLARQLPTSGRTWWAWKAGLLASRSFY